MATHTILGCSDTIAITKVTPHPLSPRQRRRRWWGGKAGGTVAHAMIACFVGDTTELMLQFARTLSPEVPRIALVDFHNDCVKHLSAGCPEPSSSGTDRR
jgi:nicotinic acid phosphoribosyltransferase